MPGSLKYYCRLIGSVQLITYFLNDVYAKNLVYFDHTGHLMDHGEFVLYFLLQNPSGVWLH